MYPFTTKLAQQGALPHFPLTLQHDQQQPATQHSLTAHTRFGDDPSCLSLVQLRAILNYGTQDQITTYPPPTYTRGSIKIKHWCSKSIKRQYSLFNTESLQQSSTVMRCNVERLISHKHVNITYITSSDNSRHNITHPFRVTAGSAPLAAIQIFSLGSTKRLVVTVMRRPIGAQRRLDVLQNWKISCTLPGIEPQIAHPLAQLLYSYHFLYPCQNEYACCLTGVWTWSYIKGRPQIVFENGVLRNMFGRKREEVRGEWGRLHDEDLHGFYCSSKIFAWSNQKWGGRSMWNVEGRSNTHTGFRGGTWRKAATWMTSA